MLQQVVLSESGSAYWSADEDAWMIQTDSSSFDAQAVVTGDQSKENQTSAHVPSPSIAPTFLRRQPGATLGYLSVGTLDKDEAGRFKEPNASHARLVLAPELLIPWGIQRTNSRTTNTIRRTHPVGSASNALTTDSSPIATQVILERHLSQIEDEYSEAADRSLDDAVTLLAKNNLAGKPTASFSEDGILTIHWRGEKQGAALIFDGSGIVSIAIKRPGQLYAENGIDVDVSEPLPILFMDSLARLTS